MKIPVLLRLDFHVRSHKYHPQTIGREERFHGSVKLERLYRVSPASRTELIEEVKSFRQFKNHERLHMSLGYRTPAALYLNKAGHLTYQSDFRVSKSWDYNAWTVAYKPTNALLCAVDLRNEVSGESLVESLLGWGYFLFTGLDCRRKIRFVKSSHLFRRKRSDS